ncbi:hypothetical protein MF672_049215 [Actinomadura sp. ATCC 31491]|uniref:MFS transporter n=1 Tax=Actinomadura luzonensis TaxID=2805427 RepID=A0ABT0GAU6_9ACTN|nr:hypothetical protein [Actinomadura luzonensis]MCK2221737.1 hypothetical protein [Actinomadura luzonensis]
MNRLPAAFARLLLLHLAVAAVLALTAGGPTWLSAGLGLAYVVAALAGGVAAGRLLLPRADVLAGPAPRRVAPVVLVTVTLHELVRLALVTWSGVGPGEAAWAALLAAIPTLTLGLGAALTAPPGRPDGPEPPRDGVVVALGGIAGEIAPWLLVAWSPYLALLTLAVAVALAVFTITAPTITAPTITGPAPGPRGRTRRHRAVAGYALMALALLLWLVR